jgi:hypothetical protein
MHVYMEKLEASFWAAERAKHHLEENKHLM